MDLEKNFGILQDDYLRNHKSIVPPTDAQRHITHNVSLYEQIKLSISIYAPALLVRYIDPPHPDLWDWARRTGHSA